MNYILFIFVHIQIPHSNFTYHITSKHLQDIVPSKLHYTYYIVFCFFQVQGRLVMRVYWTTWVLRQTGSPPRATPGVNRDFLHPSYSLNLRTKHLQISLPTNQTVPPTAHHKLPLQRLISFFLFLTMIQIEQGSGEYINTLEITKNTAVRKLTLSPSCLKWCSWKHSKVVVIMLR